jgi:hypothetical protein
MFVDLPETVWGNATLLFRETVDFGRVASEYDEVRGIEADSTRHEHVALAE